MGDSKNDGYSERSPNVVMRQKAIKEIFEGRFDKVTANVYTQLAVIKKLLIEKSVQDRIYYILRHEVDFAEDAMKTELDEDVIAYIGARLVDTMTTLGYSDEQQAGNRPQPHEELRNLFLLHFVDFIRDSIVNFRILILSPNQAKGGERWKFYLLVWL